MNLREANHIIMSRGCEYFDHTDQTLGQWQEALRNSEVNHYVQLNETTFINVLDDGVAIKRYNAGTVLSWFKSNG